MRGWLGLQEEISWSRESKAVINDASTSGSYFALPKTDSVSRFSTLKHATSELFCAKSSAIPSHRAHPNYSNLVDIVVNIAASRLRHSHRQDFVCRWLRVKNVIVGGTTQAEIRTYNACNFKCCRLQVAPKQKYSSLRRLIQFHANVECIRSRRSYSIQVLAGKHFTVRGSISRLRNTV